MVKRVPIVSYPPALVISLDFELHWGVADRVISSNHPYVRNLRGVWDAVPRLLEEFASRSIHATWATVGAVFARNRDDWEKYAPSFNAGHKGVAIEEGGRFHTEDVGGRSIYFAPDLIRLIQKTPGQEIGSHTFSHYFCDDAEKDISDFSTDLQASVNIAARDGLELRSFVFPRNQVVSRYLSALPVAGILAYRGNPAGALYHLPTGMFGRGVVRGLRLLDSFINLTGHHLVSWESLRGEHAINVCASQFLRPHVRGWPIVSRLHERRIKRAMIAAAKKGKIFHLWWHPHNFGADLDVNMDMLGRVLDQFSRLRDRYGMESLNMKEVADRLLVQ